MFQQFRDKFKQKAFHPKGMAQGAVGAVKSNDAKDFKPVLNKGAQAAEKLSEEKVGKREMAGNFMAGQTAAGNAGLEKVEKAEKKAPQTAGQTVNPVSAGGKSGLALLAIIGIVIFALTQCGG